MIPPSPPDPRPGYGSPYAPATYQRWGPAQDPALEAILVRVGAGEEPPGGTVLQEFRVLTPSVKARTRVAIMLVPRQSTPADVLNDTNTATLLGMTADLNVWSITRSIHPTQRPSIPTANIVAAGGSPLRIPTDDRLWGYEFEVETAGDELIGHLFLDFDPEPQQESHEWRLSVTYASVDPMSAEEWAQLISRVGIRGVNTVDVFG